MCKDIETSVVGLWKSHSVRLSQRPKLYPKTLCADYEIRGTEDIVDQSSDKILRRSCAKKIHPQDLFSGFKASDFSLENVIAIGALDTLRPCQLITNSLGELSDSMEISIDNAIAAVDAAEADLSNSNDGGGE